MRIAEIHLVNWMCFRGVQSLRLDSVPYAVVARSTEDVGRSNWLGKSSLLEAVDFALWGRHRQATEDAWISTGEKIGEVKLVLDSGATIIRHRDKGKRTTLSFHGPEAPKGATKAEAQEIVREVVGLDEADFLATCYFQQRQMARLVLAEPSARMSTVSGWIRLGPLERCEESVRAKAAAFAEEVRKAEATILSLDEIEKTALNGEAREEIERRVEGFGEEIERLRGRDAAARDAAAQNSNRIAARARAREFDEIVEEGTALRAEVDALDVDGLQKRADVAVEASTARGGTLRLARARVAETKALARGEFDGRCPVADFACPAAADINRDRKRGLALYEEARTAFEVEEAKAEDAAKAARAAQGEVREADRKLSRLESLRAQASRIRAEAEAAKEGPEPESPEVLRGRVERAARELDEAVGEEKAARARLEQLDRIATKRAEIEESLVERRKRLALLREAAVVFGKQGAQRRVAEGALAEIEDGANGMLREASIDLSVSVRWSREGSGLARACDACGDPFPASARVKVCARCGAGRGPNLINKLDFVLSERSGAAEDLAGAALQLSASAWLRRERDSLWETALLDEPFGQLDATNRRALGRHLAALLGGRYGFTQAFVVAHSPDVLAALPGRIEIVGGPEGSTVRVVT